LGEFTRDCERPLVEPRGVVGTVEDNMGLAEKQEWEAIQGTL
jgi:hypothetical protein